MRLLLPLFASLVLLGGAGRAGIVPPPEEATSRLWYHRNLGRAFFENPTTRLQAVEQLSLALEASGSVRDRVNLGLALLNAGETKRGVAELERAQRMDSSIPQTWFTLGIVAKRADDVGTAITQLEGMVARVADDAPTHYNLGVLYNLQGRKDESLASFERAKRLSPDLTGPHFQLYNAYRAAARTDDAARELKAFRAAKARQEGAAVAENLEWSIYSELIDELAPQPEAAPPHLVPTFDVRRLANRDFTSHTQDAQLITLDSGAIGQPDLLARIGGRLRLFPRGAPPAQGAGLQGLTRVTSVAVGDFDNDGLSDLAVVAAPGGPLGFERGSGVESSLWHNVGGRFQRFGGAVSRAALAIPLWLDFDHDGDLDLLLFTDSGIILWRNEGATGFASVGAPFPFPAGRPLAVVAFHRFPDRPATDIAVSFADRPGLLVKDLLGGRFDVESIAEVGPGTKALISYDVDRDGWTDLVSLNKDGWTVLANRRGRIFAGREQLVGAAGSALVVADLTGYGEPAIIDADGISQGSGRRTTLPGASAIALEAADFDGDGRLDIAAAAADGSLSVFLNRTPTLARSLTIRLEGLRNPKLAAGTEIEVRSGSSYQTKRYQGVPLVFGVGERDRVDVVRIHWANGIIQSETEQPTGGTRRYQEDQRLAGSCPMVFAWNGERFEFVTDVLGVAPLGASTGDGKYFSVDRDEVIQIPPGALVERDGSLDVRITEELHEVAFLDRIRLLAVDHPAEITLLTNDKFQAPPFPELRLFGVREKRHPVRAIEDSGRDVTALLLARDRSYPDGFERDLRGVAAPHRLTLDFGLGAAPNNQALLVLSGWVDWADGSTFLAAAQTSPEALSMPRLEVLDGAGKWQTVVKDLGVPAGKPKTIVVDLSGKFLSPSRMVRITTGLCVYWDEVYLSTDTDEPLHRREFGPAKAEIAFRGFSGTVIDSHRRQPEAFDYQSLVPVSRWNPTPGLYTRYGDVIPLLAEADDLLVIMGSGDEIRLSFDAAALPPVPVHWSRTFLLAFDGWAKDADANTAFSQSVEPLPFRSMSRYPYPPPERYPDDQAHRLYRQTYITRPALRPLQPLRPRERNSTGQLTLAEPN